MRTGSTADLVGVVLQHHLPVGQCLDRRLDSVGNHGGCYLSEILGRNERLEWNRCGVDDGLDGSDGLARGGVVPLKYKLQSG